MRLLSNILDVTECESEQMKLETKNVDIVNLIEDIVLSVIPYAEYKNLSIIFDTDEEEVIVAIDCNKIERVVLNLLSNAIKFSVDNGTIYVNLFFDNEYVYIVVDDDGIGIEEEEIEKIFYKFTQINNNLNRVNEGCGMGLSLVKSFIDMHKGQIHVESKIGKGSKFIVEIPRNIIEEKSNSLVKNDERDMGERVEIEFSDIYR